MEVTPQQQRNMYVLFFSIITIGALYGMYSNWHNIKTNKLQQEKLKKEGNGKDD
jgi:hypothetical protein